MKKNQSTVKKISIMNNIKAIIESEKENLVHKKIKKRINIYLMKKR